MTWTKERLPWHAVPARRTAPSITPATAGFDRASGLGSLNVANVVDAWTRTVGTETATVSVKPAESSVAINQALSVKVAVAGSSGTPTGNVALTGGGFDGVEALSSGTYTFNIPADSLAAGSFTITGSYAGNSTYAEASGTATVTVTKLTPTVTVTLNPSSVGANTQITITATVTGGSGGPIPTGDVYFPVVANGCGLTSGSCSITMWSAGLANGKDTISVTYHGDANYQSATGSAVETVNALTPTLKVTTSVTTVSAAIPFQVAITITGSGATPTGHVTLTAYDLDHGFDCNLSGGQCSITVPAASLIVGKNTLNVSYSGDKTYTSAQGSAVVKITQAATTITVKPSSASITTNLPLTLLGTITATANPALYLAGTISVTGGGYSGSFLLPGANQEFSYTIPPDSLSAGTDVLTLTYTGPDIFSSSSVTTSIKVTQWTKVAPTITMTPSATSIATGEQLVVTVAVSGSAVEPTGSVTVTSGSWSSGASQLGADGTAGITVPPNSLPVGKDTLTASYSGDVTYLTTTDTTTVNVGASSFSISAINPPAVSPGASTFGTVTAATTNGYTGSVNLTCALTSSPQGAVELPTCSFNYPIYLQNSVTASGQSQFAINTTAPIASMAYPEERGFGLFGGAVLAFLCFAGIPARRRGWRNLLGVLVLMFVFAGLGACGGGGSISGGGGGGGGGSSGTTAGTYTFTVTGTGSPAVSPAPTTTFTLTVN
ncbi:MAG: Ig-like domain repeat protein [Terracidiphilus sp.]